MANLEFYIQEINFKSEGELFPQINKNWCGWGFIAARNVEVLQAENCLGQKLESTQERKRIKKGTSEVKTKIFYFFILKCSKTLIVTMYYYCVLITYG